MQGYPIPWEVVFSLGNAIIRKRQRSFRLDALRSITRLPDPIEIFGSENIPQTGGCLLTVNHYSRPGFPAWWLGLAISATVPLEVHWVMTSAWTYRDVLCSRILTPFSRWLFSRIAQVYGFTTMPPMPPSPEEIWERAIAVRKILKLAQSGTSPVIGLAPEGGDFAQDGKLAEPPQGIGRFIARLAWLGLLIHPAACFEQEGRLCLNFGQPYNLDFQKDSSPAELDASVGLLVMRRIAAQIPGSVG